MGLFSNLRQGSSSSKAVASPPLPPPPAPAPSSAATAKRLSTKKQAAASSGKARGPSTRRAGNNNKTGFPTSAQMIQGLGLRRAASRSSQSSGSSFSCHGHGADGWGASGDELDDELDDGPRPFASTWDHHHHAADPAAKFGAYIGVVGEDGGREEIMDLTVSQLGPSTGRLHADDDDDARLLDPSRASSSAFSQSTASSFSFCAGGPRAPSQPSAASSTYTPYSSQSSGSTPSDSSLASSVQTPTLESPHRGTSGGGGGGGTYDWSFPYSTVSPIQSTHEFDESSPPHHHHQQHHHLGAFDPASPTAGASKTAAARSSQVGNRPRTSSRPTAPDPALLSQRHRSTSGASAATAGSTASSFFVPSASIASSRRPTRTSAGADPASRKSSLKLLPLLPVADATSSPAEQPEEAERSLATPTPGYQLSPPPLAADLDRSFSSVVDLYGQRSTGSSAPLDGEAQAGADGQAAKGGGGPTLLEPVWDAFLREAEISPVQEVVAEFASPASAPRRPLPPPPLAAEVGQPSLVVESPSLDDVTDGLSLAGPSSSSSPPPLVLPAILPLRFNPSPVQQPPPPSTTHTSSVSSISSLCSIADMPAHLAALRFPRPPPVSHLPSRLRSIIPPSLQPAPLSSSAPPPLPSPSTSSGRSRFSNGSSACDSPSPLTPSFPPPMPGDHFVGCIYRQPSNRPSSTGAVVGPVVDDDDDVTATFAPGPALPSKLDAGADVVHLDALARIRWAAAAVVPSADDDGAGELEDAEMTVRVKTGRKRRGLIGEAH